MPSNDMRLANDRLGSVAVAHDLSTWAAAFGQKRSVNCRLERSTLSILWGANWKRLLELILLFKQFSIYVSPIGCLAG